MLAQVVATPSQVTGKDGDMQQVSSYTSDLAELISGVVKVCSLSFCSQATLSVACQQMHMQSAGTRSFLVACSAGQGPASRHVQALPGIALHALQVMLGKACAPQASKLGCETGATKCIPYLHGWVASAWAILVLLSLFQ